MAKKKKRESGSTQTLEPEDYLDAAKDLVAALPEAHANGDFSLVAYVSGLSAECLFRAYSEKSGLPFRSDHVLVELARDAGFPDRLPEQQVQSYNGAMTYLSLRWRNNHRYRSVEALRRFLKGLKFDRGIKGDYVKENARRMLSSATTIVKLGADLWQV